MDASLEREAPSPAGPSPAAMGYRMPPEWAPHQATWISWPHNPDTWPGVLDDVETFYVRLVEVLGEVEDVHINCTGAAMHARLAGRFAGAIDRGRVTLHDIPTNDAWCRDHGATIVCGPAGRAAIDWRYNAWGGKYPPYDLDDRVAARMGDYLGIPVYRQAIVLEGGALEVNGEGLLLTTASCVLNTNRNPTLPMTDAEWLLQETLGVNEVLWLEGEIEGDDTDGHIDNLARFVDAGTVVVDPRLDDAALATLRAYRSPEGRALVIVALPEPAEQMRDGQRLPASYANFLIANERILVPGYGARGDERTSDMLRELVPDREPVVIDSRAAIVGLGSIHCLTQQVPAPQES